MGDFLILDLKINPNLFSPEHEILINDIGMV
jgi:hypothetical protein